MSICNILNQFIYYLIYFLLVIRIKEKIGYVSKEEAEKRLKMILEPIVIEKFKILSKVDNTSLCRDCLSLHYENIIFQEKYWNLFDTGHCEVCKTKQKTRDVVYLPLLLLFLKNTELDTEKWLSSMPRRKVDIELQILIEG